jgi:hypothetical protein
MRLSVFHDSPYRVRSLEPGPTVDFASLEVADGLWPQIPNLNKATTPNRTRAACETDRSLALNSHSLPRISDAASLGARLIPNPFSKVRVTREIR